MLQNLDPIELAEKSAGVIGALISLQLLTGTRSARVAAFLSGIALSYYAAPFVAQKLGSPEGLTAFLLGLFGMSIVNQVWTWIQQAPTGAIWQAVVDRLRGRKGDSNGTT